jgi:pimeloyl-ACP methyl ester carboxylesterase
LFRLGGRRVVDAMLSLAWKAPEPLDEERRGEYEAAYGERAKVSAMLAYYRAAARPRVAAVVKRSKPAASPRVNAEKMLVLWGALDPILPVSTGESVVRDLGPDCVMVTVPGAGHFVIEEAPKVVGDVLVEFLAETPDAAHGQPVVKAVRKRKAPARKSSATRAAEGVPSPGSP